MSIFPIYGGTYWKFTFLRFAESRFSKSTGEFAESRFSQSTGDLLKIHFLGFGWLSILQICGGIHQNLRFLKIPKNLQKSKKHLRKLKKKHFGEKSWNIPKTLKINKTWKIPKTTWKILKSLTLWKILNLF